MQVRGECSFGASRGTLLEEQEGLFKADAVNEEDPSATALPRCRRLVPPCYVPEGGGGGGGMFIPSKHSIPVNEEFAGRDHATQP